MSVPWIHHVFKDQHSLHKQVPCLKMIMPITFPPSISPFKRNHKGNLLWEVSISLRLKKLPPLNSQKTTTLCLPQRSTKLFMHSFQKDLLSIYYDPVQFLASAIWWGTGKQGPFLLGVCILSAAMCWAPWLLLDILSPNSYWLRTILLHSWEVKWFS